MTELLDFNARELLREKGVNLISLLQFNNQDLQKLLLIQDSYVDSTSPITYPLSQLNHSALEIEDEQFTLSRLASIKGFKSKAKQASKGIFFASEAESTSNRSINLYNHGCPIEDWGINPEAVKRDTFQVFSTGDAFSILSPDVEVQGANITIHVGLEHPKYSPLLLLHEAIQLCRCTDEHGAKEVTVALPEQFHPVLHANDFNMLIVSLFKASGVSSIYYYDKSYKGILNETVVKTPLTLTLSQQSEKMPYQVNRAELDAYLHLSEMMQNSQNVLNKDVQVEHFSRKSKLNKIWSTFEPNQTDTVDRFCGRHVPTKMVIPNKTKPHVLISCSANRPLAEKIAQSLQQQGEAVTMYEIQGKADLATIPAEAELCGAVVTIVQSTRPNPDNKKDCDVYETNGASAYFFEAAMIAKQANLRGAKEVNLINPYQFSARSDKAEDNAKGKTGAYVQLNGLLLKAAGVNKVITAECHDGHTMSGSYTNKKIKGVAVPALTVIASHVAKDWIDSPTKPMLGQLRLVTPDAGAMKRTSELTQKLQSILGKKLCESRILGEKQRMSHKDDSALISCMNAGTVGINAQDKYLITDDETATGSTLCQAITNLTKHGAKDISVIIVHNNMPLNWLMRQLCLARFLYLGVNDLHFSDTQEMGTLATSYDALLAHYANHFELSQEEVDKQVFNWFKDNIANTFDDKTQDYLGDAFEKFKSLFDAFQDKIHVHSLADEFAHQVKTTARASPKSIANPNLFFKPEATPSQEAPSNQTFCLSL